MLYHGTSLSRLKGICAVGLTTSDLPKPSSLVPGMAGKAGYAYVTRMYAPAYALLRSLEDDEQYGAVVEVDEAILTEFRDYLRPDDDWMIQTLVGEKDHQPQFDWACELDRLDLEQHPERWMESLRDGSIAVKHDIAKRYLHRVAVIRFARADEEGTALADIATRYGEAAVPGTGLLYEALQHAVLTMIFESRFEGTPNSPGQLGVIMLQAQLEGERSQELQLFDRILAERPQYVDVFRTLDDFHETVTASE